MKRKIINIDEEKCNGCGLCIPGCPEGAIQMIDNKARLVSDLFCDGLGACLGTCPQDAIQIEEREAEPYDERKVMENIVKQGANTVKAHLVHLKEHNETEFLEQAIAYLNEKGIAIPELEEKQEEPPAPAHGHGHGHMGGCPGAAQMKLERKGGQPAAAAPVNQQSQLTNWPIQLQLLNPHAPYLQGADLLVSADCVPYAYANFHQRFLKDKVMVTFCPKLDQVAEQYIEKLAVMVKDNDIKSISVLRMEVPCCGGTTHIVQKALEKAGKVLPIKEYIISINGEIM